MNAYRTITIILCILLFVGCTPTTESPRITVEVVANDTVEPTETATDVPSPSSTPEPTATQLPTIEPSATLTVVKVKSLSDPFNQDYLVTASQLNIISNNLGINNWKIDQSDIEGSDAMCHSFVGTGTRVDANIAFNCIIKIDHNIKMNEIIDDLLEDKMLESTSVRLKTTANYNKEYAVYADNLVYLANEYSGYSVESGYAIYHAFLKVDDILYWTGISVFTSSDITPEMYFEESGEDIEAALYEIFMINLGQSELAEESSLIVVEPPRGEDFIEMDTYFIKRPEGNGWDSVVDETWDKLVLNNESDPFAEITIGTNTLITRGSSRNASSPTADTVAIDFLQHEEDIMLTEGVEAGLYELENLNKGITTIGDKEFHYMTFRYVMNTEWTEGIPLIIDSTIYLYFPNNFSDTHTFYYLLFSNFSIKGETQTELTSTQIEEMLSSFQLKSES